jgi:FkbM family methyltransferase
MRLSSLFSIEQIKEKIRIRRFGAAVRTLTAVHRLPDVEMSLQRLRDRGFKPRRVFDVGAYEGEFLASCFRLWPETSVVAFEPLDDKATALRERFRGRDVTIVGSLVGDKDVPGVPFYADNNATSVLFSEPGAGKKQVLTKPMTRLDSYIRSSDARSPDFVQIDTLSFEYQILAGLGTHLAGVEAILVQLNFIEVFHDATLAHEVIGYLATQGFVLYDVCDIHRRPLDNALWQMDCLFVKADSPFRENKKWG